MNPPMEKDHESGIGYSNMVSAFMRAGLQPPLVPIPLRRKLSVQEEWCWGTRPVSPFEMYMMSGRYVSELLTEVEDHVAVSHAGHGLNSYGLQFTLMLGPVVLILQNSFGGVYDDKEKSCRAISRTYKHARELLHMIPQSGRKGVNSRRVVVMLSDFRWICQLLVQNDVKNGIGKLRPFDTVTVENAGQENLSGMGGLSVEERDRTMHGWQDFQSEADLFNNAKIELQRILEEV